MTIITEKIELFKEIRETISDRYQDIVVFPKTVRFTPDEGLTIYNITIEKAEPTFFVDSKGRKWRREE